MGPYCNFCDQHCFAYLPEATPDYIRSAYGTSTIIATCPKGQKHEKDKVGFCYRNIQMIISEPKDLVFLREILYRFEKGKAGDFIEMEYVEQMLSDWVYELERGITKE